MARRRPIRFGGSANRPSTSGYRGTTTATCSSGLSRSASGEQVGHLRGPQVLVLQVDEPATPPDRLDVAAGDRAFTVRRVRVGPSLGRIRPQHLDGVRAGGRGRLGARRQRPAGGLPAGEAVAEHRDRIAQAQQGRIRPAFPERGVHHGHRRPADLRLHVVPRRTVTVAAGHPHRLRVTVVLAVVAPAVAQVDAADERDIATPGGPGGAARRSSGDANRTGEPAGPAARDRRRRRCCRPRLRFSAALYCTQSRCDRHTRPRTTTPRRAAAEKSCATVGPSGRISWSGSPRQSVKNSRSPARICCTAVTSRSK